MALGRALAARDAMSDAALHPADGVGVLGQAARDDLIADQEVALAVVNHQEGITQTECSSPPVFNR